MASLIDKFFNVQLLPSKEVSSKRVQWMSTVPFVPLSSLLVEGKEGQNVDWNRASGCRTKAISVPDSTTVLEIAFRWRAHHHPFRLLAGDDAPGSQAQATASLIGFGPSHAVSGSRVAPSDMVCLRLFLSSAGSSGPSWSYLAPALVGPPKNDRTAWNHYRHRFFVPPQVTAIQCSLFVQIVEPMGLGQVERLLTSDKAQSHFQFAVDLGSDSFAIAQCSDCLYCRTRLAEHDVYGKELREQERVSAFSQLHGRAPVLVLSPAHRIAHWITLRQALATLRLPAVRVHGDTTLMEEVQGLLRTRSLANQLHLDAAKQEDLCMMLRRHSSSDVCALLAHCCAAVVHGLNASDGGPPLVCFLVSDVPSFHSDFESLVYEVAKFLPGPTDAVLWGLGARLPLLVEWADGMYMHGHGSCSSSPIVPLALPSSPAAVIPHCVAFSLSIQACAVFAATLASHLLQASSDEEDERIPSTLFLTRSVQQGLLRVLEAFPDSSFLCHPFLMRAAQQQPMVSTDQDEDENENNVDDDDGMLIRSVCCNDSKVSVSTMNKQKHRERWYDAIVNVMADRLANGMEIEQGVKACYYRALVGSVPHLSRAPSDLPEFRVSVLLFVEDGLLLQSQLCKVMASLLNQTYTNIELICVDACARSGYDLVDLAKQNIQSSQQKRIEAVRDARMPFAKLAQTALSRASGHFVLWHSTHGFSSPKRLALQLAAVLYARHYHQVQASTCERSRGRTDRMTPQSRAYELCLYRRDLVCKALSASPVAATCFTDWALETFQRTTQLLMPPSSEPLTVTRDTIISQDKFPFCTCVRHKLFVHH